MKTKTYFAFRIDIWDDTGNSIVEHVAGVDDFEGRVLINAQIAAPEAAVRVISSSTHHFLDDGRSVK